MKKPSILFIFANRGSETSTRFGGFTKRLKKYGALEYTSKADVAALEDFLYVIDNGEAKIIDMFTGKDIASYSFVYFKGWESMSDRAAAAAIYLQVHGIPFIDTTVAQKGNPNKLVSHFRLWQNLLPVAKTLYTSSTHAEAALDKKILQYPIVIKSTVGQKGKDNYLAKTKKEALKIIKAYPDTDFMMQEFIPNEGDWRIQVYGNKAALALKRIGKTGSHLNNTSAGGETIMTELSNVNPLLLEMAEDAAQVMDLQVAGVDIIEDKKTKKAYVLEVNQGSQIVTGAPEFVNANIPAFDNFLKRAIKRRFTRKNKLYNLPKTIIGRHELVSLPEFGITDIAAKTDTGAYHSALHAENIIIKRERGKEVLHFSIPVFANGHQKTAVMAECTSLDFSVVDIKNSFGGWQKRYKINTVVEIGGKKYDTQLTLTNRESQKIPMLLGRKLLRGNFLVNVELSRKEVEI